MAWPVDDRDYDFVAQGPAPASTFNEIQDRIVDLHSEKTAIFLNGLDENANPGSSDEKSWTPDGGTLIEYWGCLVAGRKLFIPLPLPAGSIINDVDVKFYLAGGAGLYFKLGKVTCGFGTAAAVPAYADISAPAGPSYGGSPAWDTQSLDSGLPVTIGADELLVVSVADPDVDDRVAGVKVTYEPITST